MVKIGQRMKFIFCGDRDWQDEGFIMQVMSALRNNLGEFTVIEGENGRRVKGKLIGADKISRQCAEQLGLPFEPYPAQWKVFGPGAGPVRNKQMLVKGRPLAVFAFHNDLANSKGTKNMVDQAKKAGVPVWTVEMGPDELAKMIIRLKRHANLSIVRRRVKVN